MNEMEALKEFHKLMKAKALPKELLQKKSIEQCEIVSVTLSFEEDTGLLQVGFMMPDAYDGYDFAYEYFDDAVKYLNKPNSSDTAPALC
jgi:translation elongation factor P/translation initiation factor 5A